LISEQTTDRRQGAFLEPGAWSLGPGDLPWQRGIATVRSEAAARVPSLVRPRRLPPLRVLGLLLRLLRPTLAWAGKHRSAVRTPAAQDDLPPRLRPAFEKLGCTFVKLGQLIASAEGIVPPVWTQSFRDLHDRVAPEPFRHVRKVVQAELGQPLDAVFASFERTPLAAASIAQVHAATLLTGEPVVVKVQRPGIARLVAKDLAALTWLVGLVERRSPQATVANLPAYLELFADTIVEELDFRLEAQNMLDVAEVLATAGNPTLVVPRPHPQLVAPRVLVMERVDGHALDSEAALNAEGIDPAPVLRALLVSFLEGAMVHGVFHGDLHAGNMLVGRRGQVAVFDFGITGRLDAVRRQALISLVFQSMAGDAYGFLRGFRDLGGLPAETDVVALGQQIRIEELMHPADTTSSPEEAAAQMQATTAALVAHGARLPKELFLFIKGLAYLTGAVSRVASRVDMTDELAHLASHFAEHHEGQMRAAEIDVAAITDPERIAANLRRQVGTAEGATTLREVQEANRAQQAELLRARRGRREN
jgi:ubiquinone biosynthesis protein